MKKSTHYWKTKYYFYFFLRLPQLLTNRVGACVAHGTTSQTWNHIGYCHPHFLVHNRCPHWFFQGTCFISQQLLNIDLYKNMTSTKKVWSNVEAVNSPEILVHIQCPNLWLSVAMLLQQFKIFCGYQLYSN